MLYSSYWVPKQDVKYEDCLYPFDLSVSTVHFCGAGKMDQIVVHMNTYRIKIERKQ